jgi:uncharacterized cupin superfamily protein
LVTKLGKAILAFLFLVVVTTVPYALAGSGTNKTITDVVDNGDDTYTLTLSPDVTGINGGDHFGAKIGSGAGGLWNVTAVGASTITVSEGLNEVSGDWGAPVAGSCWWSTPRSSDWLTRQPSEIPYQAQAWDAALRRNAYIQATMMKQLKDGTALSPALGFSSDPDTGIYSAGVGSLSFSSGAAEAGRASGGRLLAGSSGFGFISDPDTGLIEGASGEFDVQSNGSTTVTFGASGLEVGGSAAAPRIVHGSDTDTGIFTDANTVGFAVSGAQVAEFGPAQFRCIDGSAGTPVITFDDDTNTGIYSSTDDVLDFSAGGVNVLSLSGAGIKSSAGSAASPSYSFTGDTNTGLYSASGDKLGIAAGGIAVAAIASTQVQVKDGTSTLPGLAFIGDPDSGLYSAGANQVSLATGGTERVRVYNNGPVEVKSGGSAAAPVILFNGDTDTGLYAEGGNEVNVASAGAKVASVTSGGIGLVDGTTYDPSFYFDDDSDTGMWSSEAGAINFSSQQVELLEIGNGNIRINAAGEPNVLFDGSTTTVQLTFATAGSDVLAFKQTTGASPTAVGRLVFGMDQTDLSADFGGINESYSNAHITHWGGMQNVIVTLPDSDSDTYYTKLTFTNTSSTHNLVIEPGANQKFLTPAHNPADGKYLSLNNQFESVTIHQLGDGTYAGDWVILGSNFTIASGDFEAP